MTKSLFLFRTWLEPSKEVASFIYSTLQSLTVTEVPELKSVGLQVRGIMTLVKPVALGGQYAHNIHLSKLANYLEMVVNQEISWVASPENVVPARMSLNTLLFGQAFTVQGKSYVFSCSRGIFSSAKQTQLEFEGILLRFSLYFIMNNVADR